MKRLNWFHQMWDKFATRKLPKPQLSLFLALALVPMALLTTYLPTHAQTIEIVRSFDVPPAQPAAGLVEGPDGAFYGTSAGGGAYRAGTVYRITTTGEVTILHSFTRGSDGGGPLGALVRVGDDFYGTTSHGGAIPTSAGTVFRISTAGSLQTILTFNGINGSRPHATLTLGSDGRLYGTTTQGGSNGGGTLFRINTDGSQHEVLHPFNHPGGSSPRAGVIEGEPEVFYGVTETGGASSWGTIYSWSQGTGHVLLNSFAGGSQPGQPRAELFRDSSGNLWGTTAVGGSCGAIFKRLGSTGAIVTVHLFGGNTAGCIPASPLVPGPDGRLWGTMAPATFFGGSLSRAGLNFHCRTAVTAACLNSEGSEMTSAEITWPDSSIRISTSTIPDTFAAFAIGEGCGEICVIAAALSSASDFGMTFGGDSCC